MSEAGITNWRGKKVFTLATEANIRAMKTAVAVVERKTKQLLNVAGTGRTIKGKWVPGASVRRTKTGKRHKAAKPGKPPAPDMGILQASIMSDVEIKGIGVTGKVGPDIDHIAAKAEAGTDVEYGLYLEIGTPKMKARPYLRPALRARRYIIKRIFEKANR